MGKTSLQSSRDNLPVIIRDKRTLLAAQNRPIGRRPCCMQQQGERKRAWHES
jgi:hypothetical protein